jgi:hypothetical protein
MRPAPPQVLLNRRAGRRSAQFVLGGPPFGSCLKGSRQATPCPSPSHLGGCERRAPAAKCRYLGKEGFPGSGREVVPVVVLDGMVVRLGFRCGHDGVVPVGVAVLVVADVDPSPWPEQEVLKRTETGEGS